MVSRLELSVVAWSRYVALKLLWRIWEKDVKEGEGPPFRTFLQIFYKNFRILVLSYNLPHFFTYIQEDWRKTCPDIRSLLFLCNKDLHTRLTPIFIVCQRWRHSEKTKIGITFDRDFILSCSFFKSYFLRYFSWKNKITCFFWSTALL